MLGIFLCKIIDSDGIHIPPNAIHDILGSRIDNISTKEKQKKEMGQI